MTPCHDTPLRGCRTLAKSETLSVSSTSRNHPLCTAPKFPTVIHRSQYVVLPIATPQAIVCAIWDHKLLWCRLDTPQAVVVVEIGQVGVSVRIRWGIRLDTSFTRGGGSQPPTHYRLCYPIRYTTTGCGTLHIVVTIIVTTISRGRSHNRAVGWPWPGSLYDYGG